MTESALKTLDAYFQDWESTAFGFGYGSGEPHIMPALKAFFEAIPERPYNYEVLEQAVAPTVAWLLINVMCREGVFEYGTSPRFGWLTPAGQSLKAYIDSKTADELAVIAATRDEDNPSCYRNTCNCGPKGYDAKAVCQNPFWGRGI